ncbi:carbohydrate kinase family protein [Candidatus Gottesmanbacteria bacterium]|nr:carbohydrate kinase family protein [Candidatus Gottesmanbacteria bacterium]
MNIIVTGSLGYDYIMDFPGRFADRIMPDNIHKLSLSFLVDKLSKQFGGVAGNIAYSLKLLGVEPIILACAGNDFDPYKKHLTKNRINQKFIREFKDVPCSLYSAVTDQDDNQIGSFYIGAMKYAKDLALQEVVLRSKTTSSENFVVIAPTDPKAMVKYVKECRSQHVPYLYDPAFQIATFSPEELKEGITGAALFIGNDYEISLVENRLGISHEELLTMSPVVITTLGAKGSIIETQKESIHIKPAKPKNTSDPTGAGDAYRAGFLAGYLRFLEEKLSFGGFEKLSFSSDELMICGQMGSVAAVYTVETYGTQIHTFTKKEFIQRYRENYGTEISL